MVLVTSSIFAAVIEFAIKVSGKISAQSVKSPYRNRGDSGHHSARNRRHIRGRASNHYLARNPGYDVGIIWIICALSGCQYRQTSTRVTAAKIERLSLRRFIINSLLKISSG